MQPKDFYVYILYYADNTPMYVGKGRKDRILQHEWLAISGQGKRWNPRLYNTISKIIRRHGYLHKSKVAENLTEFQAFRLEITLVSILGRRDLNTGPLLNLTKGGDGTAGLICSEERKLKIGKANSLALKGKKQTEQHKLNAKSGRTNWNHSEETKKRISDIRRGQKLRSPSAEARANMSKARKGRVGKPLSQEHKEILRQSRVGIVGPMLGKTHSEEARKKISLSKLGKPSWNKGLKLAGRDSLETRLRKSEAVKRIWAQRREAKLDSKIA